jgi:hypothetical protein
VIAVTVTSMTLLSPLSSLPRTSPASSNFAHAPDQVIAILCAQAHSLTHGVRVDWPRVRGSVFEQLFKGPQNAHPKAGLCSSHLGELTAGLLAGSHQQRPVLHGDACGSTPDATVPGTQAKHRQSGAGT